MTMVRDAIGTAHSPAVGEPRIVSLVPSLTELLCDMGLASNLVGRSGFCIHPREIVAGIPKMGGTKDARIDRIRAAEPTHLIVNIDENRREQVEEIARSVPHVVVTHPNTPEDNIELFHLFGTIFDREAEATTLSQRWRTAREALRVATGTLPRQRVVYLIWKDPWMTVARETYVSSMLAAAGWDTMPEATDVRYPVIEPRTQGLGSPDLLLLASEPYRFSEAHLADAAERFGVPARLIDGEMASWYGSRSILGLEYLARLRAG